MPNGWRRLPALAALAGAALLAAGCSSSLAADPAAPGGAIIAIGAENEYADVIQQVGGKYVQASAIMSNPNTDPHTFEASASTGRLVNAARLVVQNGLGIVAGSYHRCGFGVLSGRPSSFCTTMTRRPESGTAFSIVSMNVS